MALVRLSSGETTCTSSLRLLATETNSQIARLLNRQWQNADGVAEEAPELSRNYNSSYFVLTAATENCVGEKLQSRQRRTKQFTIHTASHRVRRARMDNTSTHTLVPAACIATPWTAN